MAQNLSRAQKKLVLFGPPNSGKSSILLTIFGSVDPALVLQSPSEPTMGVDTAVYRWGHVDIGVFDLSGQEMEIFLTQEREFIFPGTDCLLIVFPFGMTIKKIVALMRMLANIINEYDIHESYILIHKIDLAPSPTDQSKYLENVKTAVDKAFGMDRVKIFGTSLYPEHIGKFKFQLDWILSGLEISLKNIKELEAVSVSDSLLKSLRTSGFLGVNLEDEGLAEVPQIGENGYNEMSKIKKDREIKEFDRDRD